MRNVIWVAALVCMTGCACESKPSSAKVSKHATPVAVDASTQTLKVGEPMTLPESQTVPVSTVLENPSAYSTKPVRIAGRVESVCEAKGCWVRLESPTASAAGGVAGGETLFIKFTCPAEAGGRVVPMEAKGQLAVVEGVVKVKEITEEDARHYAVDSGKSAAEIEKIKGPQKQITVSSPSVEILMKK